MKRLTIRNSDGTVSQPTTTSIEALFYRLAAYEDTGLEPEEIVKLYKENEELINATMVLRKTDNQKKQTVTYEMEYNAELSHENVRTIAKIIFDNLMKADLKHRMGDIISDDYNFDRLRELAEADKEGRCVVLPYKIGSTIKTKGISKWKGTVIGYTLNEGGLYLFIESDGHYFYVRPEEAENGEKQNE